MKNLGELIKSYRESANLPQRKLAYELDMDVSVLSRIENENRFPKKRISDIIFTVSRIFKIPENELKLCYLSDEITSLIVYEQDYDKILKASEEKVNYVRTQNQIQSKIEFNDESDRSL